MDSRNKTEATKRGRKQQTQENRKTMILEQKRKESKESEPRKLKNKYQWKERVGEKGRAR